MAMTTLAVRVAAARPLAPDVRELVLESADDTPLPPFSPGSHVVVHVPGERPRKNAYSLACAPWSTDRYRIAVRRIDAGRGGSIGVHERIAPGDLLTIEPPRNLFAPVGRAGRHVLVAGGIGITPFVSYAHQLCTDGVPFELHFAFREAGGGPLLAELRALCPDAVHAYADPTGEALLDALDDVLARQPLGTHLSICGPAPMMDAVVSLASELGWPASRVHLERFSVASGPTEPFEVRLAGDGRRLTVGEDESLLEALEAAGLDVPYLCRQGICGECRTGVVGGTPDHRDIFLTPEERASDAWLMPCVSRCGGEGPLVLDLP